MIKCHLARVSVMANAGNQGGDAGETRVVRFGFLDVLDTPVASVGKAESPEVNKAVGAVGAI